MFVVSLIHMLPAIFYDLPFSILFLISTDYSFNNKLQDKTYDFYITNKRHDSSTFTFT